MITTAAVVAAQGEKFALVDVTLDELRHDEVLVDVVAVGMCHTDLSAASGSIPFPLPGILGHEGAGRVRAIGSGVTGVEVGDPVLLTFTSCGTCENCRDGHPAYCISHVAWNLLGGTRPDGTVPVKWKGEPALHAHFFGQSSFARQAIADARSVVVLARSTSDEELALFAPLGCGLQTGAGAILNVVRPSTATILVVSGAGAVGLAAVMAAAATAVQTIVVVDIVPSRLELARSLGASHVINGASDDVAARIAEISGGRGAGAAIETTGNIGVLETMIASLAVGGTCVVIGAPRAGARAQFDVNAHLPGRRIVGVTLGDSEPQRFIPELIALYRAGRFPLDRLLRHYAFEDINLAAADAASGETIKPVLIMEPSR